MISLNKQIEILKDLVERIDKINEENKNIKIHVTYNSHLQFITVYTPHDIFILDANDTKYFNRKLKEANDYLKPLESINTKTERTKA